MTNTNKCSSLRSIIKYYFMGYSPYSKCDFNVARKKKEHKATLTAKKKMYSILSHLVIH